MANRRQLLLSQLKNNLDIVSKAIGIDNERSRESDRPLPNGMLQGRRDVDMRVDGQNYGQSHTFPKDCYPVSYGADNVTSGQSGDRGFYRDPYDAPSERLNADDLYNRVNARPCVSSSKEIESEEVFLYGTESKGHQYGYPGNSGGQVQRVASENSNFSYQSAEINSKFPHGTYGEGKNEPGIPTSSIENDDTLQKILKTIGLDSKVTSMVHELLKKDSLSRLVQNQNLTQSKQNLLSDLKTFSTMDVDTPNQGTSDSNMDVQNFANKVAGDMSEGTEGHFSSIYQKPPKDTEKPFRSKYGTPVSSAEVPVGIHYLPPPRANDVPLGSQYPPHSRVNEVLHSSHYPIAPRVPEVPAEFQYAVPTQRVDVDPASLQHSMQLGSKAADSREEPETRLYFKPKTDVVTTAAVPGPQHSDPISVALNETLSNIEVLEKALTSLMKTKTSMMLRPPGSQRDSMLLENLRMQEEISSQINVLQDTANELSQKSKNLIAKSSTVHQPEAAASSVKESSGSPVSHSPEERSREDRERSSSKRKKQYSPSRRSRSRSRSRDRRRYRSRSRSRDRRRPYGRRHSRNRSRSRSRSREFCRRYRDRSRSRDRRRSRERNVDRSLSEADRKALGFGSTARAKTPVQKAEDKEKKALELALSMYMAASDYHNGTNVWCQKCNFIVSDMYGLCQHLHSEKHQITVDPEFNKPRPPYVPEIPPGVQSAPSRGYEFILPLQAFFCSLCCEFMKDIAKAEEHLKSRDHNQKFKQFLNDNPGYELKFLKDVMTAIAHEKTVTESQSSVTKTPITELPETKTTSTGFTNPENNSEEKFRNKFQFKITGTSKKGNADRPSTSPDVEIVKVTEGNAGELNRTAKHSSDATVLKMAGISKNASKNSEPKADLSGPKGWVLKANAVVNKQPAMASKNPLQGLKKQTANDDATKSTSQGVFGFDKHNAGSPFLSKSAGQLQNSAGKNPGGNVPSGSGVNNKGPIQKSEEAVINIGDFEIFDEC